MKRNPQKLPPVLSPLLKPGPTEPDLQHDDFEPRLPTRVLRERGGLIGHLKSSSRSSRYSNKSRPLTRQQRGVRGKVYAPKTYPQQVVVKARVVSGAGACSTERMRKHRTYLSRSGTGLTGRQPTFFSERGSLSNEELYVDGSKWVNDPHHFRLIISPERGSELDLQDYVCSVMRQVSTDLETKLEWYGVCHHNTDNAHAHVVLRGVDDKGAPLIIAREYLSYGLRHVAEQEASVRLGRRHQEELDQGITRATTEERFTFIDKELVRERDRSEGGQGLVRVLPLGPDAREFAHKARLNKLRRLAFLESKGLCREERTGVWKVDENLEGILRELGYRRRVEKVVGPFLAGREEAKQDLLIYKESEEFRANELVGAVIAKDLIDELYEKRFLLLSGHDGRNHFIPLGAFSEANGFECKPGQVVKIVGQKPTGVRAEDVIHRYLGEKAGEFSLSAFKGHVATEVAGQRWELPDGLGIEEYMERFKARCESLSRAGLIEKLSDERWQFPGDIRDRVQKYDEVASKKLKISVLAESYRSLEEEISVKGASWLDRIVAEDSPVVKQASGVFALSVSRAVKLRVQALAKRGITQRRDTYAELHRQEQRLLMNNIEKRYGTSVVSFEALRRKVGGQQVVGEVLGYELLSDGQRMIVRTDDGDVLARAVGKREGRFQEGSYVRLSVVETGEGSKRAFVIRVAALEGTTKGRKRETSKDSDRNSKGRSL
jgi:type IV secretory pathway VirD2 relaxase